MRLRLRDALALSAVSYLLSVLWKLLASGFYTDIIAIYYRSVLPTNNGIPYHDYWLEYPAIPAILIWISGHAPSLQYYEVTMAFMMFFFVMGAVYFLYRTCVDFGLDRGRLVPFFIMAPSFIVMSFSNWDIIAVCFVTAAIFYAFKKNQRLTGFCLGLGFAAKNYPLLVLPVFLKEERSWRDRSELFLSAVLGALIPSLPFIIIDFTAWLNALLSRQIVYVENSIWMIIRYFNLINQDWEVNAVVWSLIVLTILHTTFSSRPLLHKVWIILTVTVLVFPSYPPQYNLWLLPFFVLIPFGLIPFLAFDFLNTSIILSWFAVDNPFQPWGAIWDISLIRIGILALTLFWLVHQRTPSVNSQ